jgi:hypothetical protein
LVTVQPGHDLTVVPAAEMRTSAAERERAVDVLKAAFAEGRLGQEEYTDRMESAYSSKTYGQLAALTADLPVGPAGGVVLPEVTAVTLASAGPPAPATYASTPVSRLAILSVVFAVIGIAYDGLTSAAAIMLALMAGMSITNTGFRGRRLAMAGLVFGAFGLLRAFVYFH